MATQELGRVQRQVLDRHKECHDRLKKLHNYLFNLTRNTSFIYLFIFCLHGLPNLLNNIFFMKGPPDAKFTKRKTQKSNLKLIFIFLFFVGFKSETDARLVRVKANLKMRIRNSR